MILPMILPEMILPMDDMNPYEPPQFPTSPEDTVDPLYEIARRASQGTPYPPEAFLFLVEGIRFAEQHIRHERKNPNSIDAVDLSWCLHDLAVYRFAGEARAKLASWNIRETKDFGCLVFRLVELGQMRTDEGESISDFAGVFEFEKEFKIQQFRSKILIEEDT